MLKFSEGKGMNCDWCEIIPDSLKLPFFPASCVCFNRRDSKLIAVKRIISSSPAIRRRRRQSYRSHFGLPWLLHQTASFHFLLFHICPDLIEVPTFHHYVINGMISNKFPMTLNIRFHVKKKRKRKTIPPRPSASPSNKHCENSAVSTSHQTDLPFPLLSAT